MAICAVSGMVRMTISASRTASVLRIPRTLPMRPAASSAFSNSREPTITSAPAFAKREARPNPSAPVPLTIAMV